MATLKKTWNDYFTAHGARPVTYWSNDIANSVDTGVTDETKATFDSFHAQGFDRIVDDYISNFNGKFEIVYDDFANIVRGWLFEREPYIRKCMEYIAAEYNPIENYQGTEHEETVFTGGQRVKTGNNVIGSATDSSTVGAVTVTDTIAAQDVTTIHAKVTTDTTADKVTTETKNAPFEGGYSDKDKTITTGTGTDGKVIGKTEVYADNVNPDKVTYGNHTDTHGTSARTDSYTHGGHTDTHAETENQYIDNTVRDFDRHGNLGQMTAAQMIEYDRKAWESFRWLRFLANELANMIGYEVTAL